MSSASARSFPHSVKLSPKLLRLILVEPHKLESVRKSTNKKPERARAASGSKAAAAAHDGRPPNTGSTCSAGERCSSRSAWARGGRAVGGGARPLIAGTGNGWCVCAGGGSCRARGGRVSGIWRTCIFSRRWIAEVQAGGRTRSARAQAHGSRPRPRYAVWAPRRAVMGPCQRKVDLRRRAAYRIRQR